MRPPVAPGPSGPFSSAVQVGPPPGPRAPLDSPPGSADLEAAPRLGSDAFELFLLEQAMNLLESPNHKVRAAVLHDLMEAQGLLKARAAPSAPIEGSKTLNQFLVAPGAASSLFDALRALGGGAQASDE